MKKIIISMIILSLTIFMLSGCMCAAEKITEGIIERAAAGEGENIDVDLKGGTVKITGDDGQEMAVSSDDETTTVTTEDGESTFTSGENLSLPENFPAAVPIPPDLNILSGSAFKDGEKQYFQIVGVHEGLSPKDLDSWYKQELSAWEIEYEQAVQSEGEETYIITANNGDYRINVMSASSNGDASLNLMVEQM